MGTVSGSGVANVVASGQFTIPLMKRFGFTSAFAGGVEATSSMGGQIMPPVMGAVAFIMAETIDVPYAEIVEGGDDSGAAVFRRLLLVGASGGRQARPARPAARTNCPSSVAELRRNWYLILPLVVLVYLLFAGFTPLFAGAVGLALTVVLILGVAIAAGTAGDRPCGSSFWVGLALLSRLFGGDRA